MSKQPPGEQLPLLADWETLPSPKIARSDRVGPYSWSRLYAGFSERFALAAIQHLVGDSPSTVLDPFAGAGTALIAGARLGHRVVGVDLDPVSTIFARAALATTVDERRLREILSSRQSRSTTYQPSFDDSLFGPDATEYATAVFTAVGTSVGCTGSELFTEILASPLWDSEVVAIAALLASANEAAAVVRGSNPVWFRPLRKGESVQQRSLRASANRWARRIVTDIRSLPNNAPEYMFYWGDFRHVPIGDATASAVLTSPPYLNRVDYVQSHLAALHLLSGLLDLDTDALKRRMMGTTKMVDKPEPDNEWGPLCLETLERVRLHASKASDTYYAPFFSQYFRDTHELVRLLLRVCRPGGKAAVVVQNSYYKDIPVPLAEIWMEMASGFGLRATQVRTEPVRQHLGSLSPSQKAWSGRKVLRESVIVMSF